MISRPIDIQIKVQLLCINGLQTLSQTEATDRCIHSLDITHYMKPFGNDFISSNRGKHVTVIDMHTQTHTQMYDVKHFTLTQPLVLGDYFNTWVG